MKKIVIFLLSLLILSCEDKKDTTPPTVSIQSPISGSTIGEIVTIKVSTEDNKGILKVEFFIDNTIVQTDTELPYEYEWDTTKETDGSHTIKVNSWDLSENMTESQPVLVTVDNQSFSPAQINIESVSYDLDKMTVKWSESVDNDFKEYNLYYSESENGTKSLVGSYTNKSTVEYTTTVYDPTKENWYFIEVTDTYGLKKMGIGKSNTIDSPPTATEIDSITFDGSTLYIHWTSNKDADFKSLTVFESENENMSNSSVLFSSQDQSLKRADSYNHPISIIRYYQIETEDVWGLKTTSNIQEGNTYIRFLKTLEGDDGDYKIYSVQQTTDGGYILNGSTNSGSDFNGWNGWLIKTDASGTKTWSKTFGGSSPDFFYSVQQTTDGGYILAGESQSFGGSNYEVWLTKTDDSGNESWSKTFGGLAVDNAKSVQQTTDGGYILAGTTEEFGPGYYDVWLIKTDDSGNETWSKTLGGSESDIIESVKQTTDGGYVLAGNTRSFGGQYSNGWLIKTDASGIETWSKTFGDKIYSSFDKFYSVEQTTEGGYILAGYSSSFSDVCCYTAGWLVKTDESGNEIWFKTFGENLGDIGNNQYSPPAPVKQNSEGGYILSIIYNHVTLIKTDPNGNIK